MTDNTQENLRLLSIFHYVLGGVTAVFSLIPLIHVFIGLALVFGKIPQHGNDDPRLLGYIFIGVGAFVILFGLGFSALIAYAGRCLARRRRYTLCMVSAGIACLFMPLGTILGVFTLVMLSKPEVKACFDATLARS